MGNLVGLKMLSVLLGSVGNLENSILQFSSDNNLAVC